jgi:diamine N-acetyltransferase
MIVRPAARADIPALSRLGIDSFVAKFGHMYSPRDLETFLAETHSEPAVAAELAKPANRYCLADQDGKLAAYCKITLACGWPEFARGSEAIELKQLYTAPALTGQGIWPKLMDWMFGIAREHGADEVQLSVWSGNHDAQRFYARYGFAKVADITYRVGEQVDDEFLFARLL